MRIGYRHDGVDTDARTEFGERKRLAMGVSLTVLLSAIIEIECSLLSLTDLREGRDDEEDLRLRPAASALAVAGIVVALCESCGAPCVAMAGSEDCYRHDGECIRTLGLSSVKGRDLPSRW